MNFCFPEQIDRWDCVTWFFYRRQMCGLPWRCRYGFILYRCCTWLFVIAIQDSFIYRGVLWYLVQSLRSRNHCLTKPISTDFAIALRNGTKLFAKLFAGQQSLRPPYIRMHMCTYRVYVQKCDREYKTSYADLLCYKGSWLRWNL